MTKHDCDICCGRGKIRLPIYRRAVALFDSSEPLRDSSREYPCPECSDVVTVEQIQVVKTEGFAVSHYENDPRFIESVKYGMARELTGLMIEQGLVKFERAPTDDMQMRFAMRLTVGVVAPSQVATLQERVANHQEQLAREVMTEAKRQIDNWGSHYGHTGLSKLQAYDSVDCALRAVLDERKKWQAA